MEQSTQRKLRILMLSPYFPWPLYMGSAIRIYHIAKELSCRGHRIVLLAGYRGWDLPGKHDLNAFCNELHVYNLPPLMSRARLALHSLISSRPYPALWFQDNSLAESLHRLLRSRSFDLIWVNFLLLADMLPPLVFRDTPVVVDEHEIQELLWRGYLEQGSWWQRLFALINLGKLKRLEKRLLPKLKAVLCVCEEEAALMRSRVPSGIEVWRVPNGVDVDAFRPIPLLEKDNSILLCGNMAVRRNIDAAIWFAQRIFPTVRKAISDAELWIVGSWPDREVSALQQIAGVRVYGNVEDVRPYYAKAKVVVSPYRFGAGTKLKILEALASGTPIVSTAVGCRGIEVVDGQHVLIADNEADFSARVIELVRNAELAQTLAAAGRALVEEKYDWKVIVGALEPKLHELVRQARQQEGGTWA